MTYIVAPRGPLAGRGERLDLGMRPAELLVPAFADDLPIAARSRSRPSDWARRSPGRGGQLQSAQHEASVGRHRISD